MDKNSIIGWVLIALLMIGFFGYQSRQVRKQQAWQAQLDSIARREAYKQDICLLNVRDGAVVECLKVRNMVKRKAFEKDFSGGSLSLSSSGLLEFLRGEQIFVWDAPKVSQALKNLFGTSVEFNLFDVRPEAAKIIPSLSRASHTSRTLWTSPITYSARRKSS